MKKTLKKLLKRNILTSYKQFLSIIIIVFLSMTLLSGFIVNFNTLSKSVDKYFEETKLADAWLYVDNVAAEDEQFFIKNKLNYEKRLELNVLTNIETSNVQNNSKIFVYDTGKISTPYIVSGLGGCFIDQNVAKNNNLKPGQDIINFSYDYLVEINGKKETVSLDLSFLIEGTMTLCECADSYSEWPILIKKEYFLDEFNKAKDKAFSGVMSDITPENISDLPYNQILLRSKNINEDLTKISNFYEYESTSKLIMMLKQDSIESVVLLRGEIEQ